MADYLDSPEFEALLNQYRYAQLWNTVQHDKAIDAIKAYIRAQSRGNTRGPIPADMVAVPRAPTAEMVGAVCALKLRRIKTRVLGPDIGFGIEAAYREEYSAMITAYEVKKEN